MPVYVALIIGGILAIGATIAAYILIIPEKKRAGLNKFLQWVHDVCTFKSLLLEHILRAVYVFMTAFCLLGGFFLLFSGQSYGWSGYQSNALQGILLMILGPIVVRISFELTMMMIIAVKKIINIDNKMTYLLPPEARETVEPTPVQQPVYSAPPVQQPVYTPPPAPPPQQQYAPPPQQPQYAPPAQQQYAPPPQQPQQPQQPPQQQPQQPPPPAQ